MFSDRWRPFILGYFVEPYTNGFVEGINAIIGDRWRAGRGYSLDVLRFKMVVDVGAIALPDGLGDRGFVEDDDDGPDDWDDAAAGRSRRPINGERTMAAVQATLQSVGLYALLRETLYDGADPDVG